MKMWQMKWFKHILLFIVVLVFAMQQAKAESGYTYGDEVVFKSDKVFMYFGHYDDNHENSVPISLFTVILKSSKEHLFYPQDSKLVVKFANDSVIELRSFGGAVRFVETSSGVERADNDIEYTGRNYNPYYDSPGAYGSMPPLLIYFTGRNYQLEDTDMQKLLMWPIVKVEVELADGVIKKFIVSKRQGKKVLKGLQDSWRSLK